MKNWISLSIGSFIPIVFSIFTLNLN